MSDHNQFLWLIDDELVLKMSLFWISKRRFYGLNSGAKYEIEQFEKIHLKETLSS